METGWIKLHRNITEHWLWKDEPYDKARAWIDLIMLANYEDKKTAYKDEVVTCKRGDVNLSIAYLAKRWKWDRKKVRRFLSLLESDNMVTLNATTHRTTITIVNYGNFQDIGTTNGITNGTTNEQQMGQQVPTTKKYKKDKKDKNILPKGNRGTFVPPTPEEVKAYCSERGNKVDAEKWYDFYSSKGWMIGKNKMKDWKAAVRTWERSSSGNNGRGSESLNGRTEKDVSKHRSIIDCNFD